MSDSTLSRRLFLGGMGAGAATLAIGTTPAGASGRARPADSYPADVVPTWISALYDAVFAEGLTPPRAARFYAYCSITGYEAAMPGMPGSRSLARQLNGLRPIERPAAANSDWPTVVSASIHRVARSLLHEAQPATLTRLDDVHAGVLAGRAAEGVSRKRLDAADRDGRRVADALLAWMATDGYADTLGQAYTPPTGPGMWRSTPPNFGTAIEPHWDRVRTLVLDSGFEVVPAEPTPYSPDPGSPFRAEVDAVLAAAAALTDEQRAIALFWTDNPRSSGLPSGHWHSIASQLCATRGMPLSRRLEVHARLGIALHDAFASCWVWKYHYNLLRPVTYIRDHIDPTFTTYVNTPQFPEYTSGHSVGSGAAATVLTDLFGTVAFTDHTHAARGLPARSFRSVWHAADEAAMSRLYGGIHYPMGIEHGVAQGRGVGDLVLARLTTRRRR